MHKLIHYLTLFTLFSSSLLLLSCSNREVIPIVNVQIFSDNKIPSSGLDIIEQNLLSKLKRTSLLHSVSTQSLGNASFQNIRKDIPTYLKENTNFVVISAGYYDGFKTRDFKSITDDIKKIHKIVQRNTKNSTTYILFNAPPPSVSGIIYASNFIKYLEELHDPSNNLHVIYSWNGFQHFMFEEKGMVLSKQGILNISSQILHSLKNTYPEYITNE